MSEKKPSKSKNKTKKVSSQKDPAQELYQSKRNLSQEVENNQTLAIIGLLLNIFIPGTGSLIGGRTNEGILQLSILFGSVAVGFVLTITIIGAIIGIPILILGPLIAWIWGLITGVQMIMDAN